MKKILIYFIILTGFTSCDSWIQLEPEISVTYTNYFKTEKDAEALLVACFLNARYMTATDIALHHYMAAIADEVRITYPNVVEVRKLSPIGIAENNGSSGVEEWDYRLVHAANVIIDNEYRFKGRIPDDRLDFYVRQAYFFKGLGYYLIARKYGDAPLPSSHTDTKIIGRSPVNEVLKEAMRCAEKALELPEWNKMTNCFGKPITSKQWASKGMATALLANIHAWKGALEQNVDDTKKAVEYCTQLLEGKVGVYAMHTSPEQLVTDVLNTRNNAMAIYEITISQTESANGFIGQHYPLIRDYKTSAVDKSMSNSAYPELVIYATTVNKMYENKDLRRTAYFHKIDSLAPEGEIITGTEFARPYKFRNVVYNKNSSGNDEFVGFDVNRIVWRMADIKLLRAECRNRAGLGGAIDDLNDIRAIAGATLYPGAPGDGDDMKIVIFREREKELIFEWERYYDVVRNGLHKTHMNPDYPLLSDTDVKNGALYMPIPNFSSTGEYTNDMLIQYPFWNGRR